MFSRFECIIGWISSLKFYLNAGAIRFNLNRKSRFSQHPPPVTKDTPPGPPPPPPTNKQYSQQHQPPSKSEPKQTSVSIYINQSSFGWNFSFVQKHS